MRADEVVRAEVDTKAFSEVTLAMPLGNPRDDPCDPLQTYFPSGHAALISEDDVTGIIDGK